jgi:hypothetical protein
MKLCEELVFFICCNLGLFGDVSINCTLALKRITTASDDAKTEICLSSKMARCMEMYVHNIKLHFLPGFRTFM